MGDGATDPMNSDMAAVCGYQNRYEKEAEAAEEREEQKMSREQSGVGGERRGRRRKGGRRLEVGLSWAERERLGGAGRVSEAETWSELQPHQRGSCYPTPLLHAPLLSLLAMSAATADGLNDVYEALEAYNWDNDAEFQSGLSAILGTNSSPEQATELALRARCFYYSRCVVLVNEGMRIVDSI